MNDQAVPELSGLKRRLLALFAAVSAAVISGAIAYDINYRAELKADAENLLLSVEKATVEHLTHWTRERVKTAESLLDTPFFSVYLNRLAADHGDREAAALCRQRLEAYLKHNPYDAALIAGPDGQVLVSAGLKLKSLCPVAGKLISRADSSGKVEIGEFYRSAEDTDPHIDFVVRAARGPAGRKLFLLLRSRPKEYLYPLLDAWPVATATGETLLARRDGDKVTFLSWLRKGGSKPMTKQLPLDTPELPAALALKGRSGVIRGVDYSGADVLAAVSPLPGTSWAVVTKINWDEIMRDAGKFSGLLALLTLALMGAGGTGAYLLFRLQAEAYERAYREAAGGKKLAEAELRKTNEIFTQFMEHSPIHVFFKDENIRPILLSRNFEKMVGRPLKELIGRSMDELFPSDFAKKMVADDMRILREGKEVVLDEELDGRNYITTKFPISIEGKPRYLAGYTIDVTEQKQAEAALRRSEQELKEAQRLARIGNWTLDLGSGKLYWSEEIFRIFEIDPEKFGASYEAFLEAIHPEDREAVNNAYTESLKTRAPYDIIHRLLMSDGRIKYVNECCETVYGRDGRALRSVGTVQDITERRRAEEELRASKARLQSIMDSMLEGCQLIGFDWRYLYLNNAAVTQARMARRDLVGHTMMECYPGIESTELFSALRHCMQDRVSLRMEYEFAYPDGTRRWHDLGIQPAEEGLFVMTHDITASKLAAAALRESEAAVRSKLQALLSPEAEMTELELGDILDVPELQAIMDEFYKLTNIGIGIIDIKGKVLVGTGWQDICTKFHRVNPKTARNCLESDMLPTEGVEHGKCKSYLCKNNLRDIATPIVVGGRHLGNLFLGQFLYEDESQDEALFRQQAVKYGFDEKEYLAAYERLPRFGREQVETVMRFYMKFSELISTLSYGKIKLARALAQSRQAESEKEKINLALASKNQEMENFLYITTHDLRSPLVNIQGFSQNLEHYIRELKEGLAQAQAPREIKAGLEKLTGEKIPEALDFVIGSSRKMDALISALLKVSRVGRVEMKPETIEMGGLLQKVLDAMRFQLETAGAEVKAGALPPCKADPGAVNQLFSNLIDNAVKYRDESRRLVVGVEGELRGDRVLYKISDNGPGIPRKDLEKIWNVFYSHERPAGAKGEGIGLPMVRRLVEKSGGSIRAESDEGQGMTFYIELPAVVEGK